MSLNLFDAEKHHIALGAGGGAGFYDLMMLFKGSHDLRGYWRLGDGGGGPYADSVGERTTGYFDVPPLPMHVVPLSSTGSITDIVDVSGALPAGQDDGAVSFIAANGVGATLQATNLWGIGSNNPFDGVRTITGWCRPLHSASSTGGHHLKGSVFSTSHTATGYQGGYALCIDHVTLEIFALRGNDTLMGPVLPAGQWYFLAMILDGLSTRLYVNGDLVASSTLIAAPFDGTNNVEPKIGMWNQSAHGPPYYSPTLYEYPGTFYGQVDEVAVWGGILAPDELKRLYHAGPLVQFSGPMYGFTLDNAYAKFMQKETTKSSGSDFGGTLDLITSDKPEVSRWTQDEFTGGAFQYSFDTDQAMFADCIGYMPSQQSKSLTTVAPVFFKKAFNPEAQLNAGGRANTTIPHSMFTVAGSIFVGFEHGILRYLTGTDATVWGNTNLDPGLGVHAWYAAADYDRNEQCIYALVNFTTSGQKPYLIRLDPETLALFGSANQTFNNAPEKTRNQLGYGMQINDQHIVLGIGLRLYTVDPPEKPSDPTDLPVWTHIGRLPGRWIDSVPYNGMTYILTATEDSKTQVVAFDGTYILPIANLAFNFSGRCMTVYGGRVYIGGVGTDINGEARYAELHELTGASTRLVRTFAPESYQSHTPFPKDIWDLTVAEGLLWWSEKNIRLWTYDLTGDAFFGSSMIQHPNVNFYTQAVGRERLWLWGSHDSITGQHGIYRVAIAGDTVAPFEATLATSDFLTEFALEKRWHEIVVLARYHEVTRVDYSTDGGATWNSLGGGVPNTSGDLKFLTFDLSGLPTSKVMRFRFHQPMGTTVDDYGELIAYTVSFTFTSASGALKHGWNLIINGAENVEARDGSNQYQDVDLMKTTFWTWAEEQRTLGFKDLGGAEYLVKMQDFVEQQPLIGPNVTNGVGPEAYFAVTLLEV